MAEQMEQINVEEIMNEIKEQIKTRGYTEKELKFADISNSIAGLDDFYEFENFKATIDQVDSKRVTQCWYPIHGNKLLVIIKKIIRRCIRFYVEPIVVGQNEFNNNTASALSQICAKFEREDEYSIDEMQKKIDILERRIAELEKKCGE